MISRISLFALPLALFALGCSGGSSGKPTVEVKGKVTLDGQPLASGKIVFDEGPTIPATELEIKNGAYEGKTTPGSKTVRITSFKAVSAPKGMAGGAYEKGMEENFLPAKYNTASKDIKEVKDGSKNEFDFADTSK